MKRWRGQYFTILIQGNSGQYMAGQPCTFASGASLYAYSSKNSSIRCILFWWNL